MLDDDEVYICPECDGRGYTQDNKTCHVCNGKGVLSISSQTDSENLPSSD